MFPPRSKDHLTRTPRLDMGGPLLSCWPELSKRLPKYTAYCYCLCLPLEVEGKSPLLKVPWTSETRSKDLPKQKVTWVSPPLRTSFHCISAMQLSKGGRQPAVQPIYDTFEPHKWAALRVTLQVHQWHAYFEGNNCSLIGLKTSSTGWF